MNREIQRIKHLYRPIIDLDNNGQIIKPDFEKADEALDKLFDSFKSQVLQIGESLQVNLPTTVASLDMQREELRLVWNQAIDDFITKIKEL